MSVPSSGSTGSGKSGKPALILLHGALHSASCWADVVPLLEGVGLSVHAPTYRGHEGRPMNPFRVTMRTYVEDVVAVAEQIGRPSTLVAHSMGGIVASLAAELDPTRWSRIVFLSGFLPGEGRSSFRHLPTSEALRASSSKPSIRGTVVASPHAAREVFYNECDDSVVARIPTLLCPQPLRPFLANFTFTRERLGVVPKSYIECLRDRAIEVDMQRGMHSGWLMDEVANIDADHMAMLSRPHEVAAAIAALAA